MLIDVFDQLACNICILVLLIVQNLSDAYVNKVLNFVAKQMENSRHLHFYLLWCYHLLTSHGAKLKQSCTEIMPLLRTLQKNLTRHLKDLGKL